MRNRRARNTVLEDRRRQLDRIAIVRDITTACGADRACPTDILAPPVATVGAQTN
jgi:hypothetical protein